MPQRAATPEEMCALFPEFANDKPEFLQVWLDVTVDQINFSCWLRKASTGHAMLTAHYISTTNNKERGPANAKEIDKIKISYAAVGTATQLDAHFATTRYGRMYLAVRSTLLITPIVGRRILNRPVG